MDALFSLIIVNGFDNGMEREDGTMEVLYLVLQVN